jgi:hypothetical protein
MKKLKPRFDYLRCYRCGERDPDKFPPSRVKRGSGTCRACNCLLQRDYTKRRPEASRKARLKHFYGITPEAVEQMIEKQKGACACCGASDRRLVVDHCHKTGRVRGMLCSQCNVGIGYFGDCADRLLKAIAYLTSNADSTPA